MNYSTKVGFSLPTLVSWPKRILVNLNQLGQPQHQWLNKNFARNDINEFLCTYFIILPNVSPLPTSLTLRREPVHPYSPLIPRPLHSPLLPDPPKSSLAPLSLHPTVINLFPLSTPLFKFANLCTTLAPAMIFVTASVLLKKVCWKMEKKMEKIGFI